MIRSLSVVGDNHRPDTTLFHAGTSLHRDTLKTSGGRVLAATAVAATLEDAIEKAYQGVRCIKFEGMQYRRDIAHRYVHFGFPSQTELLLISGQSF